MGFSFYNIEPEFTGDYITVRAASEFSGYNQQYIRRLLKNGTINTRRIGQIWLIEKSNFIDFLIEGQQSKDKRFGPQSSNE